MSGWGLGKENTAEESRIITQECLKLDGVSVKTIV